jgi:hypothetical protein
MASKTPTVAVTLRKDRRFKTWIARIVGPNADAKPSKNGRTYEFSMEFIDAAKSNDVKAEFALIDGAFYMLAQPAKDGSGREVKRIIVNRGTVAEIDEATIRVAFKMAPKATKSAQTVEFSSNAVEI